MDLRGGRVRGPARVVMLATACVLLLAPAVAHAAATLPQGYEDELVAQVPGTPVAFAFTPDGTMLVPTRAGVVRVIAPDGQLLETPAMSLSGRVCTNGERGVAGIAVDPNFTANRRFYLYYTFNRFVNNCPNNTATAPVNRVSSFTLGADNRASVLSEEVLVDNIPSPGSIHNGGDLHFGKDGLLYISVGDGGCDYDGGTCGSTNDAARDMNVLVGKILRVTSTGGIPPDNPHQGLGTARCNSTGRTTRGVICQEIFATGLRNPFRMAFDPNAATTRFHINDVGAALWEEIDVGQRGADYGWNVREGFCARNSTTICGPPPLGMTNPIYAYRHTDCSAITGGAFVPGGAWPAPLSGSYLFGDYTCGKLWRLVPGTSGGFTADEFATNVPGPGPISMTFGPAGTGPALYYSTFANGGEIRRIRFTGAENRKPLAELTASPASGPLPLSVTLDGSASSDPDGDPLTYLFDPGDGSPVIETGTPSIEHVYNGAGVFQATLRVRDSGGLTSEPAAVEVQPGNTPPSISFQLPAPTFRVGQRYTLEATATDPEDGPLPGGNITWTVVRHHADHTHPFLEPTAGQSVEIVGPEPEDFLAVRNTHLEVIVTATDSSGLTTTLRRDFDPLISVVWFRSDPSGATNFRVNGFSFTTPFYVYSWAGLTLVAEPPELHGAEVFHRWKDDPAAPRVRRITTPDTNRTYTVEYRFAGLL